MEATIGWLCGEHARQTRAGLTPGNGQPASANLRSLAIRLTAWSIDLTTEQWMPRRAIGRALSAVSRQFGRVAGYLLVDEHGRRVSAYRAAGGDTSHRLAARIEPGGMVVDLGAFSGDYIAEMAACNPGVQLIGFEPISQFAELASSRFAHNPNVTIHACGVARSRGPRTLHLAGDATSAHASAGHEVSGDFIAAADLLRILSESNCTVVDVLKLNIEGDEYDVLEDLARLGYLHNIRRIDVQFHDFVADSAERYQTVRTLLSMTHKSIYDFHMVWEGWVLSLGNDIDEHPSSHEREHAGTKS